MKLTFDITEVDKIIKVVQEEKRKLIIVAWASASGKSYFAEQLKEKLESMWKKVLSLSSDNYYVDNTRLKHTIYGTFDHPKLIRYDELGKDIKNYLKTWKINIPEYSFVESGRVGYNAFKGEVDYVIVEWLYTISSLPFSEKEYNPLRIFVNSAVEELIMRRLVRDQERTKQAVDAIIGDVTRVFPMWNIYGQGQKNKADITVHNDYEILDAKGKKFEFKKTNLSRSECGTLKWREYFIDFEYNDSKDENGSIVISEVYKSYKEDLSYVVISKKKLKKDEENEVYAVISMKSSQLGIITQLHTLMQLAGLTLQNVVKKTLSTYEKDWEVCYVKERKGKRYLAV